MSATFRIGLCCFVTCVLTAAPLLAGGLKDFDDSGQMNVLQHETYKNRHDLYSCKWGEAQTNYWRLFCSKSGVNYLADWLNLIDINYKCPAVSKQSVREWVELGRTCYAPDGARVDTLLMVPHPRYVEQVSLMKEFRQLEPPVLAVESTEALLIEEFPAKLHRKKDGSCSILIKLAKESVLNFTAACDHIEQMKGLGKALTIDALNKKLQS